MKLPTIFTVALVVLALTIAFAFIAKAEDCPKGVPSCKVVVMTPEEIATLNQPGGLWDQAIWANRSGMTALVEAWKKKIETAPAGTVKTDEQKQ